MSIRVSVYVPGLLPQVKGDFTNHPLSELALPALHNLLCRAQVLPPQSLSNLLNTRTLPYAALRALGEGIEEENAWFLCADPVHLIADQATVYLGGQASISLNSAEITALATAIQPLLPETAKFYAPTSEHWYLSFAETIDLQTHPLLSTIGKDIYSYLPFGKEAAPWKRLLTEIQMSLFNHPLNQQRQQQGQALINSLWFWGEGCLKDYVPQTTWQAMWGDTPLFQGLATTHHIPYAHFSTLNINKFTTAGDYLISALALEHTVKQGQMNLWQQQMQQLDKTVFTVLLSALLEKDIHTVFIYDQQKAYKITRSHLKSWWRRKQRFADLTTSI